MQTISTVRVGVEADGEGAVGMVGLHLLGSFADRLDVAPALSAAVPWSGPGSPVHDRGVLFTQLMLMLAGGGKSTSDIEHLRVHHRLFGSVASDSTAYRACTTVTEETRTDMVGAFGSVRRDVWARSSKTNNSDICYLDVDGSLVEIHSENKEGTAPTYKRGFGFHPLICFADATGEPISAVLRPGNATSNNAGDHLQVIDEGLRQLPETTAAGHRPGDDPTVVQRPVVMRADSAGCSQKLLAGLRDRNIGFAVVARRKATIHAAILGTSVDDDRWEQAVTQAGEKRSDAHVIELTNQVDMSELPDGTRFILRREPKHVGAQTSLQPEDTDYRYWGHYTDQQGDPVELDRIMRGHTRVEDNIRRLKASGLNRFPFSNLDANRFWLDLICWADSLVRWFQTICLTGPLAKAEPDRLRWELWHTPARVIRKARKDIIRLITNWPATNQILAAYKQINALT